MKKLSTRFNIEMPLGASNLVDEVGATLVKKYGKDICYIEGERFNIKITTRDDLVLAKAIEALRK